MREKKTVQVDDSLGGVDTNTVEVHACLWPGVTITMTNQYHLTQTTKKKSALFYVYMRKQMHIYVVQAHVNNKKNAHATEAHLLFS